MTAIDIVSGQVYRLRSQSMDRAKGVRQFVQVISGKVTDLDAFDRLGERWNEEFRPGAAGYLGVTEGTTDDGRFFVAARFESAEAAAKNSACPEQGAWFAEMEKVVENVTFHDRFAHRDASSAAARTTPASSR